MNPLNFVKGFNSKISRIVFYKILAIIIISITIPITVITMLSIKHSTDHIVKQVRLSNTSLLLEKQRNIDQKIKEISNMTYQFAYNKDVWNLMKEKNQKDIDAFEIIDVISVLSRAVTGNKMIDSIYLYNDNHDFILSNSKYLKNEFGDQEIFNLEFTGYFYCVSRQIGNKKVISYLRKFNFYNNNNNAYVVVNINYDEFFKDLIPDKSTVPMEILLFNSKYSIINSKNKSAVSFDKSMLKSISESKDDSSIYKTDKLSYVISKVQSDIADWTYIYVQPYSELVQTTKLLKNLIITSLLIVLALSFILAVIFSIYLYKPLSKLVYQLGKYSGSDALKGRNEYKIINEAVQRLSSQNVDLLSKYLLAFPFVQQHSIHDFLTNRNFTTEKFKSVLNLMEINFIHSKYIPILIDFENTEFTDRIKESIEAHFVNYKEDIIYILSAINDSRIAIIINTDNDIRDIYSIILEMKNNLNKNNVELTISLGKLNDDLNNIYVSYQEVLQQMDNKFFVGKNEIINFNVFHPEGIDFFYDKRVEEEMHISIKSQNAEEAIELLKKLTFGLSENFYSTAYIKYIYFRINSNITYSLSDIGIELKETETYGVTVFEKIQKAQTFQDLYEFTCRLIRKSISMVGNLKKEQHSKLIDKTIDFIKSNFQRDLPVEEVSSQVFLSSRYLNSIFKAETGLTISDYITKLRMEAARELILNNHMKINEVSKAVGYNNIQSFIRLFKKHYNMTPIDYKRKFT